MCYVYSVYNQYIYSELSICVLFMLSWDTPAEVYAAFVDLVKAFGTVNHDMILKILERYVAPTKLRSAISRMYQDLKVFLKMGKIEEKTSKQ